MIKMQVQKQKKQIEAILSVVSIVALILSLWVFVYLLGTSGITHQQAQASTYSKDQVLLATNLERKNVGLPKLLPNDQLNEAAQNKANHMAANNYFSHIHKESGKRWSDFIKESGYEYTVAGENLANGFFNIEDMVQAWMNSPTHKENILNESVDESGIGIAIGELENTPTIFVVQVFGKD